MNKVIVSAALGITLIAGVFGLLSCAPPESPVIQYQRAKLQAELKVAQLEEIMGPVLALEKGMKTGDFSSMPTDPEEAKRYYEKFKDTDPKELVDDLNDAMLKVSKLVPPGYEDDYHQWVELMRQRLAPFAQ